MSQDGKPDASSGEFSSVDKELDDIQENEVKEGDPAVKRPPSSTGSNNSSASATKPKRRTWKKPKDKPKRPLSAYNIFFKHERSRIVEGLTEDATAEEAIRSIENILSTSRETRRHRKTHGRISFGDLARKIAEKWKNIAAEQKAVFEHYAELDMRRYRQEVKIWKEKKESEAYANKGVMDYSGNSMSNSFSSVESESDYGFDNMGAPANPDDPWAPRRNFYDSMNSSFSSACSVDSELSLEPIPIGDMLRNARPNNLHNSMPNLNMDIGFPGMVGSADNSSQMMGNQMDPMIQFGQQSLSSVNFGQNQQLPMQMNNGSAQPSVVSSNPNPSPLELQQLRQQNSLQQQQLQRQQHILMRQQQLLQQQLQQTTRMMNNVSVQKMEIPPQMNPAASMTMNNPNVLGDGSELTNFLSNLES